jgi:hypothetical protein
MRTQQDYHRGPESTEEKSVAGAEKLFQRTAISSFQVSCFPSLNSVNFVN